MPQPATIPPLKPETKAALDNEMSKDIYKSLTPEEAIYEAGKALLQQEAETQIAIFDRSHEGDRFALTVLELE